jgi:hypothetical protein
MKKETQSTIKKLQTKYRARFLKAFKKNQDLKDFIETIKQSKENSLSSISRIEARKFDEEWINELEQGIIAIGNIIANPKRFIKFETSLVPVEMAKKTSSESIRHLAQNSQYIKKIDEKGNVFPEKILNISTDDEYGIYENRFVVTLIRKLIRFIELRYDYIQKKSEVRDSDLLFMKSKIEIQGAFFEYEGKLRISVPSEEGGRKDANDNLLKRIVEMRQRAIFFLSSEFMRTLKDVTPVTNPIQMTNILKKNPDYTRCYELWKFLDRYEQLGVSFQIKETNNQFNDSYISDIFAHIGGSYLTVISDKSKKIKVDKKQIKKYKVTPKLETPILDKDLTDDKFLVFEEKRKVSVKTLTPAQEAAIKKRREEAEKKRRQKQLALAKKKAKEIERRAREHERKRLAEIERKKKAEQLRAAKIERERQRKIEAEQKRQQKEREKAEELALKKIIDEERKRLIEARKNVKKLAAEQRKLDENIAKSEDNQSSTNELVE